MKVVVTGIALISALGESLEASWQRLISGQSGIQQYQIFPVGAYTDTSLQVPLGLIGKEPTALLALVEQVVAAALNDAGLAPPLPDCGVVLGSSRSQQAAWEHLARERWSRGAEGAEEIPHSALSSHLGLRTQHSGLSSPHAPSSMPHWLETLPHMGAIAAARQIGATGAVLAPMAACATGIWAIAQGFELIRTGQCQRVIAGAVEAPITPLTLAGFKQMGALATTGAYPFDRYREGLVLGEGAALLVLELAELAQQRGASIYGEILGFGLTADAYHLSAPELGGKSAIAAIKQCLQRSHLTPSDINYIHAHGTGTQLNDQNEANLIQHLFSPGVPVSSTKGATGHTLGASGALGAAFCLMALKHQILPPCIGLKEPEFDLNLVTQARRSELRRVLCLSFGFGGQNAVMALGNERLYFD